MYDATSTEQIIAHARTALRAINDLNHTTLGLPELLPDDIATTLEDLAALTAALPQTFAQLHQILQAALIEQPLSMDEMSDVCDPAVAIGTAQHQLDEAREQAMALHTSLDDAYHLVTHIISHVL